MLNSRNVLISSNGPSGLCRLKIQTAWMKFLASLLKTASGEQYTIYYIPYIISDDPFLPIYRPVISFADFWWYVHIWKMKKVYPLPACCSMFQININGLPNKNWFHWIQIHSNVFVLFSQCSFDTDRTMFWISWKWCYKGSNRN